MIEQNLPNYREDFRNALWQKRETVHYLFHYTKNSLAESEIEKIIKIQEEAYQKITQFVSLCKCVGLVHGFDNQVLVVL